MAQQLYGKQQNLIIFAIASVLLIITHQVHSLSLGPLVQTGVSQVSPDGRHVSVNLPLIFNMDLDTRGEHNGAKMDQTVLSGLVRVNKDRTRGADGRLHGPLKVSIAGFTVYDNGEESSGTSSEASSTTN